MRLVSKQDESLKINTLRATTSYTAIFSGIRRYMFPLSLKTAFTDLLQTQKAV